MKYALSMARTYVQDAHAEAAASKRLQVLDAAIDMLASEALPRVTLEAVARRAGAARSTVYVMFGSRAGLFDAVARRLLERIGFDRLVAAVAAPEPLEALRHAMHESVRLYAEQRDAARAVVMGGSRHRRGRRLRGARRRPRLRHRQPRPAPRRGRKATSGVSPDEAADVLYMLTSFDTFDQLFTERQLTPDMVERRLRLLLGSIVSI